MDALEECHSSDSEVEFEGAAESRKGNNNHIVADETNSSDEEYDFTTPNRKKKRQRPKRKRTTKQLKRLRQEHDEEVEDGEQEQDLLDYNINTLLAKSAEKERAQNLKKLRRAPDEEGVNEDPSILELDEILNQVANGCDPETGAVCLNSLADGTLPDGKIGTENYPALLDVTISRNLKPHQIIGTKFLWSHISTGDKGFGCILADYMGLGKSLQVISVVHAFLKTASSIPKKKKWRHVIVVAPAICVRNWEAEFKRWLPMNELKKMGLQILESAKEKTLKGRFRGVQKWYKNGGVLVLGYELYRQLVLQAYEEDGKSTANLSQSSKSMLAEMMKYLCDPGPDLIVLDEGHRIRNPTSKLVKALSHVTTHRRIILTGYPLQNHLVEYYTMVNFARPNFLGTREEFKIRFETPINNGLSVDCTAGEIKFARQRAYVLTTELKPLVLRRDQQYLYRHLPPKKEWVILCKSSTIQAQLYRAFVRETISIHQRSSKVDVLGGFHICMAIHNHPDSLYRQLKGIKSGKYKRKGSIDDFIVSSEEKSSSNSEIEDLIENIAVNNGDDDVIDVTSRDDMSISGVFVPSNHRLSFAESLFNSYKLGEIENGAKILILFSMFDEFIALGDRVTVFSQSLHTLDIIGELLDKFNRKSQDIQFKYLRIDGSTPQGIRFDIINRFNDENEDVDIVLISTKAGGEGINLIGGNRIIIFDVCWNPCHDSQSMCRSYRFGQRKPVHVYRLISAGTMEKKVYDLQVKKEGVSKRIIDDTALERRFKKDDLQQYFSLKDFKHAQKAVFDIEKNDNVSIKELDFLFAKHCNLISDCYEQESMFEENIAEKCPEEEQEEAMRSYRDQKAKINQTRTCGRCGFDRSLLSESNDCQACEIYLLQNFNRFMCKVCSKINYIPKGLPTSSCTQCKSHLNVEPDDPPANMYSNTFRVIPERLPTNLPPNMALIPNYSIAHPQVPYPQFAAPMPVVPHQKRTIGDNVLEFNGLHALFLRRGVKDSDVLESFAKSYGMVFDIEFCSQTSLILSGWPMDKVLKWLKISELPPSVVLKDVSWLRNLQTTT